MSRVTYTHSYPGVGEMLRAPWMEAEMRRRGENVKALAEAIAPHYEPDPDGRHYKDAFHVETSRAGGIRHDRAAAEVVNDNSAAVIVEFGNRNTPKHATLRKALDAAKE
jgi:hypothetical protein